MFYQLFSSLFSRQRGDYGPPRAYGSMKSTRLPRSILTMKHPGNDFSLFQQLFGIGLTFGHSDGIFVHPSVAVILHTFEVL